MKDDHIADKCVACNFKTNYSVLAKRRAEVEGNFGCWCIIDENIFCQEREGCDNCTIKRRHAP